jgi:hypothetical protein
MMAQYDKITDLSDHRIKSVINYAKYRMNYLIPDHPHNEHYPCPIIFYSGR